MNKGFNAPRLIETFDTPISDKLFLYLDLLKSKDRLQHIRIPGGTLSQDYSPITGGGNWVFQDGRPLIESISTLQRINVPVIYVANLLKVNSIDETMYALDLLKANGIDVKWVELGNELFAFKDRHGISYKLFVDTTDKVKLQSLISDLNIHITLIRNKYPNIKIAVPVAKPGNMVNKRYNDEMFKLNVDAYSYHVYIDFGKEEEQLKGHSANIKLFKSKGKEVWITEYNMQFNNPSTNQKNYLSDTHINMLYNRMPSMFEQTGCTVISRHSLWGNNKVSPFFPHITIDNKENLFIIND